MEAAAVCITMKNVIRSRGETREKRAKTRKSTALEDLLEVGGTGATGDSGEREIGRKRDRAGGRSFRSPVDMLERRTVR